MAKLYASPIKYNPDYKLGRDAVLAQEEKYLADLRNWLHSRYKGEYTGKIIRFSVADGYASYMIMKTSPIELIHLPFGDAYHAPEPLLRGLSLNDIKKQVAWEDALTESLSDHEKFYASLKPGQIVHYHNGFGEFIRGEVVAVNGKNMLKQIALVGNWKSHDLPRRLPNGEIAMGHHAESIFTGELFEPNYSNIYESPAFSRKGLTNPADMQPVDLTVPPITPEEAEAARLWKLIDSVKETLNRRYDLDAKNYEYPKRLLLAAKELLESGVS